MLTRHLRTSNKEPDQTKHKLPDKRTKLRQKSPQRKQQKAVITKR